MNRVLSRLMHTMVFVTGLASMITEAQFSGNNISEYQLGNIPGGIPADMGSHYNQMNLKYMFQPVGIALRAEHFISRYDRRGYFNLSQYSLQYRNGSLTMKAGHFYEMLGNGLLLRAYEIPGNVYEDQAYRVRHGFYRDLEGFKAGYEGKIFHVKGLMAMPLVNLLPPTARRADRRIDLVQALNSGIRIGTHSVDVSYLRNSAEQDNEDFASVWLTGNIPLGISYNLEVAGDLEGPLTGFGGDARYAAYVGLNYSNLNYGGSVEWKVYHAFLLGSGFNDPPTLVKEHSYKVLNRSTHVPLLDDEQGYQVEGYYRFETGHMFTLNHAYAVNKLWKTFIFREYFAELFAPAGPGTDVKLFIDYTLDEFGHGTQRYASGGMIESLIVGLWGGALQAEFQRAGEESKAGADFSNFVFSVTVSRAPVFTGSIVWEASSDPLLTDDPDTPARTEEGTRHWIGIDLRYKIDSHSTLYVFGGRRRGGSACTSGICYEVLDFTGLEVRLTTKF